MRPAWESMVARAKAKADRWEIAMGREPIFGPFNCGEVRGPLEGHFSTALAQPDGAAAGHEPTHPTYTLDNFPRDLRSLVEWVG